MRYGFIIDNRKCIGCHACTVACKSEHDVAIGVNRTYVKQVEKGSFPDTRRVFSVMRCNHCTDAPCTTICPTSALFTREDGIVDFDNNRCIGCKSCMQACPYDALYIDPDTNTAAKCNYCAHRTDIGLEPACVNVCPEHAIISGDMENPETEIAQLLSREQVSVRKPEKNTKPNLFYINGDLTSLNPSVTERSEQYIWGSQERGVGHFSKFAEKLASEGLVKMAKEYSPTSAEMTYVGNKGGEDEECVSGNCETQVEGLMKSINSKRVYDTPDKGILWGWEVWTYVWTKAISAGLVLVPFLGKIFGFDFIDDTLWYASLIGALIFLSLTGIFLIKDLDQPKRFAYVLLRPHWESWLVKGGYSITIFGALITGLLVSKYFELNALFEILFWAAGIISIIVAAYTAFLFAQAKGRDFWQSPSLALHMVIHSILAGASALFILSYLLDGGEMLNRFLGNVMLYSIVANLLIVTAEMMTTHPTTDAKRVVTMILKGRYKTLFWVGAILIGSIVPLALIFVGGSMMILIAALLILIGSYITEKIWVEAPQRIPLT